jgi:starch phosphorylase
VVEKSLGLVGSNVSVVYLENYDMELGRLICAGVDLWLNNPVKPLEASGTSGMKAAINGSPNFSTLDGWWVEGCVEGITGWEIKDDAYAFGGERDDGKDREKTSNYMYQMLNDEILRLYYKEPELWNQICRHSIALNGPFFNTHRMVWEYNQQVYKN